MTNLQLTLYSGYWRNISSRSTLAIFIQHSFESHSHAIREEKERNGVQIGKEVRLSMFADDTILYIDNPNEALRKLLDLIHAFG